MMAAEGLPPMYLAGYLKTQQREYYDSAIAPVDCASPYAPDIAFGDLLGHHDWRADG
jgi:hypothetical protein